MKIDKPLLLILFFGVIIRLAFYFYGAELYYGKSDFFIGGDTTWWLHNFKNLLELGVYTDNPDNPYGYFTRTPGYSFFLGIFYLLFGKNDILTYKIATIVQVGLDVISIYLVFKIALLTFKNRIVALLSSLIYATYPFIIVWNVIAYAESLSVFLMLLSIYLFIRSKKSWVFLASGIVMGLAILTRIQLIVLAPIFFLSAFILYKKKSVTFKNISFALLAITITYASWPLRNFILHDKLVFSQHLGDSGTWAPDIMRFRDYIWSVKTDWEPQMSQILTGEKVVFPKESYIVKEDSILLDSVVVLARNCGQGFSHFSRKEGYRDTVVTITQSCNTEIETIFTHLINNQKKHNPFNYYVKVPLNNLQKAFFKFNLYSPKSNFVGTVSKFLFLYRSLLIFLGFAGLIYILLYQKNYFYSILMLLTFGYVPIWYLFQSAYYRNMEIRFLLHADLFLIFPAALILYIAYSKFKNRLNYQN